MKERPGAFRCPARDIKGTAYCGPFALAVVLGLPLSETQPKGRTSMYLHEVVGALRGRGVRCRVEKYGRKGVAVEKRTLAQALARANGRGIAFVTRHFVAFDGLLVLDSWVSRWTWVHDHRAGRRHTVALILIED